MQMTKQQLIDHLFASHGGVYFTARDTRGALVTYHQDVHADLTAGHEHDPKTGRPVPAGECMKF